MNQQARVTNKNLKNMKTTAHLLIALLLSVPGIAQLTIEGKVVDENAQPVAFAAVRILKNTAVVSEKISAEDGSFKVSIDSTGYYGIQISHASYQAYQVYKQVTSSLTIEPVHLKKSEKQLEGVTVSTRKPMIIRKTDRISMDVANNALSAGKSSLELFQLAPGVFVNNGKISINGNPGTRVMVDGKRLQISGDDLTNYLSSLRAENIQSIEIIAHPPAEFDAEGSGGYINIVLKKQKSAGLNGSANAGYTQGRYAGTSEGLQLNFKDRDLSLFASYSHEQTKDFDDTWFSRPVGDNVHYQSTAKRVNSYTSNRVHVGGAYDISRKQYIALDYTGSFRDGGFSYNSNIAVTQPQTATNRYVQGSYPVSNTRRYHNVGVNYHLNTDTAGSGLTILSDYTQNETKTFSSAQSNFYDDKNQFLKDTLFRNATPSTAKVFTADGKYIKVLNATSALTLGAKLTHTNIYNSGTFESFSNSKWDNRNELNYIYDYQERIVAGYASYSARILKTTVQLGLRAEHTHTHGDLVSEGKLNERKYFNLFPTVFMKRGVGKGQSLSFYYGKRVSRPSYSDLNPYQSYADNYTIGMGNPYLNPSFIHSFEMGYTFKNKYTLSVSYDRQKDLIAQYALQSDTDPLITIYTRRNFGKRSNAGISLYTPFALTKWWTWNNNIIVRRESVSMQDVEIAKTIFTMQAVQVFSLPKGFSFTVNATYYSNLIMGNFLFDPFLIVDAGIQKKLMKNKLILKSTVSDIGYGYQLNGNVYFSNTKVGRMEQKRQSRTFNLSAIYNFDLGKSFKARKIESSSLDEQNRLK